MWGRAPWGLQMGISIKPKASWAGKTQTLGASKPSCHVRARRLLAHRNPSTQPWWNPSTPPPWGKSGIFLLKKGHFCIGSYAKVTAQLSGLPGPKKLGQKNVRGEADPGDGAENKAPFARLQAKHSPELPCLFHRPVVCSALSKQTQGDVVPTQNSFQAPAGQNARKAQTTSTAILTMHSSTHTNNRAQKLLPGYSSCMSSQSSWFPQA